MLFCREFKELEKQLAKIKKDIGVPPLLFWFVGEWGLDLLGVSENPLLVPFRYNVWLKNKNESINFNVTPLKLNRSQTSNRVEANRSQQQIGWVI